MLESQARGGHSQGQLYAIANDEEVQLNTAAGMQLLYGGTIPPKNKKRKIPRLPRPELATMEKGFGYVVYYL